MTSPIVRTFSGMAVSTLLIRIVFGGFASSPGESAFAAFAVLPDIGCSLDKPAAIPSCRLVFAGEYEIAKRPDNRVNGF